MYASVKPYFALGFGAGTAPDALPLSGRTGSEEGARILSGDDCERAREVGSSANPDTIL